MEFIYRVFNEHPGSYFLFGPRGTGKSSLLKNRYPYPNSLNIDLLEPYSCRSLSLRPGILRAIVEDNPHREVVIIYEIQKVPGLLGPLFALMKKNPRRRFILTGSSTMKLKRAGVDLSAGGTLLCPMHPFMAVELEEKFSLTASLKNGLIPVIYSSRHPAEAVKDYVERYIPEELRVEKLVRNIGEFSRFLETISFSHASILNVRNVAGESGVHQATAQRYIDILEDLFLAFTVPAFPKRAGRAAIKHPKFYFIDPLLFNYLRSGGPPDMSEEMEGPALEGLVAQHLRAWAGYRSSACKLYYRHSNGGPGVIFIVYGEEEFWAIEVKNSSKVHPVELRTLNSFVKDYPECTPLLLYRGKETIKIKNILCLPCEEFLKNLSPLNDNLLPVTVKPDKTKVF